MLSNKFSVSQVLCLKPNGKCFLQNHINKRYIETESISSICRKVCTNCRCGKAEHNVQDLHDPGFYFVGKILDRPLRSKEEEMEFCFGDQSSDEDSGSGRRGSSSSGGSSQQKQSRKKSRTVKFDWIPPNISKALVRDQ